MSLSGRFGSVICAMITPFDKHGVLDIDGAVHLARWLVDHGNDGLVLSGTTGEGPVLTDQERIELWRAVQEEVTVPVIAGTGTADTAHSVELTKAAAEAGVAGVLAVTPYYSRPPQSGIIEHFRAIAEATDLPVMAYDIPVRTGRKLARATIVQLAAEGTIVALKDAAGSPADTAAIIAEVGGALEVYSGDDSLTLPLLAVGALGVVSVASHWAGEMMAEMLAAVGKSDWEAARSINARLIESWEFESTEDAPNPLPTKAMMRMFGLPSGHCRLPMGAGPEDLEQRARKIWERLGGAGE